MAQEINISRYIAQVRKNLNINASDEIIEKDLLLTLILAEFEKTGMGKSLIFKGGTLLSRNYLTYHRFSEDLDFTHKDSNELRELKRNAREKRIKTFINYFAPELKKAADRLGLIFSTDRSDTRFCTILHGRAVYIFRLYYSESKFIKIEINFVEKIINTPKEISIKAITDLFDSKELLFTLGLKIENFRAMSYTLEEIILEKYRAILTRDELKERDIFDIFLIKGSINADNPKIIEKIKSSSLIKRNLKKVIKEKEELLEKDEFFTSDEKVEHLAIVNYNKEEFEDFKKKLKPKLLDICKAFLGT